MNAILFTIVGLGTSLSVQAGAMSLTTNSLVGVDQATKSKVEIIMLADGRMELKESVGTITQLHSIVTPVQLPSEELDAWALGGLGTLYYAPNSAFGSFADGVNHFTFTSKLGKAFRMLPDVQVMRPRH